MVKVRQDIEGLKKMKNIDCLENQIFIAVDEIEDLLDQMQIERSLKLSLSLDSQISRTVDEVEDLFDSLQQRKGLDCYHPDFENTLINSMQRTRKAKSI